MVQNAATTTNTTRGPDGSLGTYTKTVTTPKSRTAGRHFQRDTAGQILGDGWRVSDCGKILLPQMTGVTVKLSSSGNASFHGLNSCGNVWTCPVCAAKITTKRRNDLQKALIHWPGSVAMVTVTLQHDRKDKLIDLLNSLRDSWQAVKTGGHWTRTKKQYGIMAEITALEVTWGSVAGWHPHMHIILFFYDNLQDDMLCKLKNDLTSRYKAQLDKRGGYATADNGIKVSIGNEKVGNYVAKFGLAAEMTDSESKNRGGLKPFDLLTLAAKGNKQAIALFHEYAKATHGRRQLVFSANARKLFNYLDREDEELAAEDEEEAIALVKIAFQDYLIIARAGKRGDLLAVAEKEQNAAAVASWLMDHFGIKCKTYSLEGW